jgi:pimeloyl-ACP methyl ester carboxylesterase
MFITKLPETREVAGAAIELLIRGEGDPILFLHAGHGVDADDPLIERLAGTHKVYAASHPGFGGSDLPRNVTTVDDLAYAYLDLIEELGLTNVTLVGVSFGAWLAVEIATKGTGRIARLVLIDAVGVKFSDRDTRDIADIYATTIDDIPPLFFSDAARGRELMGNFDFPNLPEESATRFARNRESLLLFGWSPTLYNPKLLGRLHRVREPALVLWGADDRIVSTDYGRLYADALPNGEFSIVEDAGHYGYLERPDAFADRIHAFLAT